ncbi:acyl-homoserine-lactone synthase [Phyllobacterium leguminum]|uniref:Acyl-homoserine-lactone synthase n=1 Tax=Phyllobacterium leguminum TaxID=314237 RepID=A0A318T5T6_9HYPH|nr:acyl-homoserine-lactone synthase [Phyllobacterium leguminum]PYE87670.1 acyl homoserine lactone synthase [Phyllobacterium leguminum]
MLHYVHPHQRPQYRSMLDDYFRLRKTVFHDRLGWSVNVTEDMEKDVYDTMDCLYILSTNAEGKLLGGLRQMVTTGPTLTWEVFSDLVPDRTSIMSPRVWETTRFCVSPDASHLKFANGMNRVSIELSLGALEYGIQQGVTRHIAVCERTVFELSRSLRVPSEILGSRIEPNGSEILCVAWEVNEESAARLKWTGSMVQVA